MRNLIAILMLTCLPTTLALSAERPDWAYPPAQQGAVPTEPDDGKPLQAAGSSQVLHPQGDQLADGFAGLVSRKTIRRRLRS